MNSPKIVILGSGYGGIVTAQNLAKRLKNNEAEITIVNKHDYHYLTTELHQPAAGTLPFKKVKIRLNEILNLKKINLIEDEVIKIDIGNKKVLLKNSELHYDYLVVSLGAEPETFNVPGIKEHTFHKWTYDGISKLNNHIEKCFKLYAETNNPEYLTFVVSGGGFTGVEFVSELAYSIPRLAAKYHIEKDKVRLILVDPNSTVLPHFDPKLIQLTTEHLTKSGVELFTNKAVSECKEGEVLFKDETSVKAKTIIWAAGVRGSSIIENTEFEHIRCRVKVDRYLRAPGYSNEFVIGDCALFIDEKENRPYPPTAQISIQMGQQVSKNILVLLRNKDDLKPFEPKLKGTVASLGQKNAVGVVMGKKIKGPLAVFMKKVIDIRYLFIIGGLRLALKKGRF